MLSRSFIILAAVLLVLIVAVLAFVYPRFLPKPHLHNTKAPVVIVFPTQTSIKAYVQKLRENPEFVPDPLLFTAFSVENDTHIDVIEKDGFDHFSKIRVTDGYYAGREGYVSPDDVSYP